MSQFAPILQSLKSEDYSAKKQLLAYLLHIVQSMQAGKKALSRADRDALMAYAFDEVRAIPEAISAAASYREKDVIFACEDALLGLIMHLCPSPDEIPQEQMVNIRLLVALVERQRYIETTLDRLFQQQSISAPEIRRLLAMVNETQEEYHKGKFYVGLLTYRQELSRLSDEARACICEHLTAETRRYLAQAAPDEDCINCLEIVADISRHFADDALIALLHSVLARGLSNINYYAVETLLSLGEEVPVEVIHALARDWEYANLSYGMLKKFGKQGLFPPECATAEYLAKSDMVHWLMYPTELGKAPDEIEYIGKISYLLKKEVYHVFKYRSDSDTLDEQLKNMWLLGWSSEDGGTFSNFDEYALYEQPTIEATLKTIKKKLIG